MTASENLSEVYTSLIIGLSILEKNIGMYPAGHSAVVGVLGRVLEQFSHIFAQRSQVTIMIFKESLKIDEIIIEGNVSRTRDFATTMSQRGIATLTFSSDLTGDTLIQFYGILNALPQRSYLMQHEDLLRQLSALVGMQISTIDLGSVSYTDKDVIDPRDQDDAKESEVYSLWDQLVRGCLPAAELLTVQATLKSTPPDLIASSYKAVLKSYFNTSSTDKRGVDNKKTFFSTLYSMLPEFSNTLKDQILIATFENMNTPREESALEEFVDCIPNEMVIAVLEQAKHRNREISPALMKLLSSLSRTWKQAQDTANQVDMDHGMTQEQMQKLLERELYEQYVLEDYGTVLRKLSMATKDEDQPANDSFFVDAYSKTLDEDHVNRIVNSALLALMDNGIDSGVYAVFAHTVAQSLNDLLVAGEYDMLIHINKVLVHHTTHKKEPSMRQSAVSALRAFSQKEFIDLLANHYAEVNTKTPKEATALEELICMSGTKNSPWLLQLLQSKNEDVRIEAVKMLLRIQDPQAIPSLRKMLMSKNKRTAAEAFVIIMDCSVHELATDLANMLEWAYISKDSVMRNEVILDILGALGNPRVLQHFKRYLRRRISFTPKSLSQTQGYLIETLKLYPKASLEDMGLNHYLKEEVSQ